MVTTSAQLYLMALILAVLGSVYASPYLGRPMFVAGAAAILFPLQTLLWRLGYGRKAKDFFFCFSVLVLALLLKHYWSLADLLFYALAILMGAVLRYRVFAGIGLSALALETWREYFYATESPQDVAFRYVLFFIAGTLTFLLLRDEKRQKEEFKKELDDLKYGIQEVSATSLSGGEQVSRAIDAAAALDDAIEKNLQLIHSLFKPERSLFWQFIADKKQLRVKNRLGGTSEGSGATFVSMGEGPIGWTALNKKAFFRQDRQDPIRYLGSRKKSDVHSLLAVPVLEGDRLEGVLSIDSPQMNYFPAETEQSLSSFAGQLAETIRMARLAREREERAVEFQAFYHASRELSSIIDFDEIIRKLHLLCAEIVPFDFSLVAVLQPQSNTYNVFQWEGEQEAARTYPNLPNNGRTWISWFLCNREEPLIITEAQLELQEMPLMFEGEEFGSAATFLAIPLRHQQKCLGALVLGSNHEEAFSSHQTRIVSILCNQAAVSLENASIIDRMQELAITDGLTGLFNHRFLQDSISKEIERAERQKQALSLLICDIDHFKGFNDSHGHPAGDFLLKSLAELMQSAARKIDVLARYGGEEFAALLPGVDKKNARKTGERWRKTVERASFKYEGKSFAITLSIGYASFPEDAKTKTELIEKADRALYIAKEQGRNQVRHWSEDA